LAVPACAGKNAGGTLGSDVAWCHLVSRQKKMLALLAVFSFDCESVRNCPDLSAQEKILNARLGSHLRNLLTGWEYTQSSMAKWLVENHSRYGERKPVTCGYASDNRE